MNPEGYPCCFARLCPDKSYPCRGARLCPDKGYLCYFARLCPDKGYPCSFARFCPEGTFDNSPTLQRWDRQPKVASPEGTTEESYSDSDGGARRLHRCILRPLGKLRACPCGLRVGKMARRKRRARLWTFWLTPESRRQRRQSYQPGATPRVTGRCCEPQAKGPPHIPILLASVHPSTYESRLWRSSCFLMNSSQGDALGWYELTPLASPVKA